MLMKMPNSSRFIIYSVLLSPQRPQPYYLAGGAVFIAASLQHFFLFQVHHKAKAEQQLYDGGHRRGKADVEQRRVGLDAHKIRYRHTHAKRADDALQHDKPGAANTVVKAGIAEENGGKQAVDGVSFQVIRRRGNYAGIRRENARQHIPVEERQKEHPHADNERNDRTVMQRLFGAVHAACAIVLSHKGRNGLHERRGNQHDKGADLFRYANARRSRNAHGNVHFALLSYS